MAVLAMDLKFKHKYSVSALLILMGILPDIDHLIHVSISGSDISIFHNFNVLLLVPLSLFLMVNMYEAGGNSSKLRRFFLALTIILSGHLVMDLVAGSTIIIQYPPNLIEFSLSQSDLLSFESVITTRYLLPTEVPNISD